MSRSVAIKERFIFSKAYSKGKSFAGKYLVVYLLPNYRSKKMMLGITVSKKLGGAVQRARVRRIIREAFRIITVDNEFNKPYYVITVARSAAFDKKVKTQDIVSDFKNSVSRIGAFASEKTN